MIKTASTRWALQSSVNFLLLTSLVTQVKLEGIFRVPDDEMTEIRSGVARDFESQTRLRRCVTTTTSAPGTIRLIMPSFLFKSRFETHDRG